MKNHPDVVIAGGGIIGSATACFLAMDPDFDGRVAVLEPDPTYARAATALSASSIRQQFSTPVNIEISKFGAVFIKSIDRYLTVEGQAPAITLCENGYLLLATQQGVAVLERNAATVCSFGVPVSFLDAARLRSRFPWLALDDITAGSIAERGEGWFDAYSLLQGFRRKARSLGVEFHTAAMTAMTVKGDRITSVSLSTGTTLEPEWIVNSAGTAAPALARLAGIELPVERRKRCVFVFECRSPIPDCPLVIDPSGLYFRPEGAHYICGLAPDPDPAVEEDDFRVDYEMFEERIWPLLAARVPVFEAIKLRNAWAGHYDFNVFDHNAILGPVGGIRNLLVASGFSGHGLQQAPAVGRGLAELIVHGGYRTLDLSPLGADRLVKGTPLRELNVY